MLNKTIIDAIEESNKWWKGEFKLDFKPRTIYTEIKNFFDARQILALTGLRRIGKTTLMLKLAEEQFDKIGTENTFYFSFDDFRKVRIKEVINTYARLMNKDLNKGNYLFLFDEIQKVPDWGEQLKRIYDNFRNIKIIVSGSESLFIMKKTRESLAGRFFEFNIKQLTFKEYLGFVGKKFDNLLLYREEILREFNNYLLCNGFPELIGKDKVFTKKYLKEDVIEKIIYRDIPQIFQVENSSVLDDLFKIILLNPGEILNIDDLSRELSISRQTIINYLSYLEKSFLIKKLYNFSKNARKSQRKLKKYYPVILMPEILDKTELIGKVFESIIVLNSEGEFFWRDQYKNEVDLVLIKDEKVVPIEIKYSKIDYRPLKSFMKKFNINKGFIVTHDTSQQLKIDDKEINIVPFYELLLCWENEQ